MCKCVNYTRQVLFCCSQIVENPILKTYFSILSFLGYLFLLSIPKSSQLRVTTQCEIQPNKEKKRMKFGTICDIQNPVSCADNWGTLHNYFNKKEILEYKFVIISVLTVQVKGEETLPKFNNFPNILSSSLFSQL